MEENWKIFSHLLWKIAAVGLLGIAVANLRPSGSSIADEALKKVLEKNQPPKPAPLPEPVFDFKILAAVSAALLFVGLLFLIFKKWKKHRDARLALKNADATLLLRAEGFFLAKNYEECAATLAFAVVRENLELAFELEDLQREFAQLNLLKSGLDESEFLKIEKKLVGKLSAYLK